MNRNHDFTDAARLEAELGDPGDRANAFHSSRLLEADEREVLPEEAIDALRRATLCEYMIPTLQGGLWRSVPQLLEIMRVIARRDLALALGCGPSLLGGLPVWIAGTDAQRKRATRLARGRGLALANTERAHGSDLLGNETRAESVSNGFSLTGENWLISNATTAGAWVVLARTGQGPRGQSLFFVDRERVDPSRAQPTPRASTVGLRGADLSGVRFRGCVVPTDAMIGRPGTGFELVHRTLSVTRTLCAGLSLGAGDTCLRTAADFAFGRRLFGQAVTELPAPRSLLVGAFVDLLVAHAVAMVAARAVQARHAAVFHSALSKFFVPTLVESLIRDTSVVLGARFFLRGRHHWAGFQKAQRDHAIVSVFEGNTLVNLSLLAARLTHAPAGSLSDAALRTVYDLGCPLLPIDPPTISLDHGADEFTALGLPSLEDYDSLAENADSDERATLMPLAAELRAALLRSRKELVSLREDRTQGLTTRLSAATKRHCRLQAAAVCFNLWRFNRETNPFFRSADWLTLALIRLLHGPEAELPQRQAERVLLELQQRVAAGRTLTLWPCESHQSIVTPKPTASTRKETRVVTQH